MMLPLGAALVALCAALAAYVMVKFFGVIFLGQPREPALARAHDAGVLERIGLSGSRSAASRWACCPRRSIGALRVVVEQLSGASLPNRDGSLVAARAAARPTGLVFGVSCFSSH